MNPKKYNQKRNNQPEKMPGYKYFTGAKIAAYAMFYNIASQWMDEMLKKMYKTYQNNSSGLDDFIREGYNNNYSLPDAAYIKLRDYMWKGYLFEKNKSGEAVTINDKSLIHEMINKLNEVRNFHSHYYHDNINLVFNKELAEKIDELHEYALSQLDKENGSMVNKYKNKFLEKHKKRELSFFDIHEGSYYISQEGRNFFLSFFLKNSEMTRFMQHREGCKRNDKPEFKIKHMVYRFYTHRDGASKNRYSIEETAFSGLDDKMKQEILNARQFYRIISYLNDVPIEVIDKESFPLYYDGNEIKNAIQLKSYIESNGLFPECQFSESFNEKNELIHNELEITYNKSRYKFVMKVPALHKLILDLLRNPESEQIFYKTLDTFGNFRNEFPKKIDDFANGDGFVEDMNEYYSFKLRTTDKTRGKLAILIDSYHKQTKINLKDIDALKKQITEEPIYLTYYDLYYELDKKPRPLNRFMEYAVQYLVDFKVVPEWEWLVEKLEPEEIQKESTSGSGKDIKIVIKRKKKYVSAVPDGYRLSIKDDHILVRLKSEPNIKIGLGKNAIRNLLITHFHGKDINTVLKKTVRDITKIKEAASNQSVISFEELELLNSKTMPRYLQLMMQDKKTLETESMDFAIQKAQKRIQLLVAYFRELKNDKIILTRKEINTQLIRCYKFFNWKYENNEAYKFLRQDEYQLMSIYHYTLAKNNLSKKSLTDLYLELSKKEPTDLPENTTKEELIDLCRELSEEEFKKLYQLPKKELSNLCKKILIDNGIYKHIPKRIKDILKEEVSLDGLYKSILSETIELLEGWKERLPGMTYEHQKDHLSKLSIHVPKEPVPQAGIKANLDQMKHLPLMLHPSLVFKALGYTSQSTIYAQFRNDPKNNKGLIKPHYQYQPYLDKLESIGNLSSKHNHKIIGTINDLKTLDTLLWKIGKEYFTWLTSDVCENMKKILSKYITEDIGVNNLHDMELPVFESNNEAPKFKVIVKFKQLGDFMLITDNRLERLANQVLKAYPDENKKEEVGIQLKDSFYEIPYILIKQGMDKIYHESLMVTDMVLDWEKETIDKSSRETIETWIKATTASNADAQKHINFKILCNFAFGEESNWQELKILRNQAFHANIPEGWSYKEKLYDDTIQKMINITSEKLKKYEKKDSYYEAKALLEKEFRDSRCGNLLFDS